jgi:YHS domain-containing protein
MTGSKLALIISLSLAAALTGCGDDEQDASTEMGWQEFRNADAWNLNADGVAIEGYSPVAYTRVNQAMAGDPQHQVDYEGVTFYLADNLEQQRWQESPQSFLPLFGGWCAWSAAQGERAPADPRLWRLAYGKVVLFSTPEAMAEWNQQPNQRTLMNQAQQWWISQQ